MKWLWTSGKELALLRPPDCADVGSILLLDITCVAFQSELTLLFECLSYGNLYAHTLKVFLSTKRFILVQM